MRVVPTTIGSDRLNEEVASTIADPDRLPSSTSIFDGADGWERAAQRGRQLLGASDG